MHSQIFFDSPQAIAPELTITRISGETESCHLISDGDRSLLVNCIQGLQPKHFPPRGLPVPDEIWHTEISPGLAAEGCYFEGATIRVPSAFADVAADSDHYRAGIQTVWERPEEWVKSGGREPYGIAGCTVLHPPSLPLRSFLTFEIGVSVRWGKWDFEVLDFGIRHFYAVGYLLEIDGRPAALFSGSLIDGNGDFCDAHGFEAKYGGIPWEPVSVTLRETARRDPAALFPSQGRTMTEPRVKLDAMAERIESFVLANVPPPVTESAKPALPAKIGRYRDHGDGVFQITNFGNIIMLIDLEGRGLLVDPGPCDFLNPRRREEFLEDLDRLEAEAGLRKVELTLVTHFHGDHYDFWPLIKERYPDCQLGAWGPVADVIEHPEAYPYACRLPWYGVGWERCQVDIHLSRRKPTRWHGTEIHSIHLPGHCNVHAAYWLQWQGRSLLLSGDSIQTSGGIDQLQYIMANHSIPGTKEGHAQAYENAGAFPVDLNLGGHSSYFTDCQTIYAVSREHIQKAGARLLALFGGRNSETIFLRPNFWESAVRSRALMTRF